MDIILINKQSLGGCKQKENEMKATWTTQTGKVIDLTTEVTGKTSLDHVATLYKVVVDGKLPYYNGRRATKNGMDCIEIQIRTQKFYTPIPEDIASQIDNEFTTHKKSIIDIQTPDDPEWLKEHDDFCREFYAKNSDL